MRYRFELRAIGEDGRESSRTCMCELSPSRARKLVNRTFRRLMDAIMRSEDVLVEKVNTIEVEGNS